MVAGVVDPDQQEEVGLFSHNGAREEYMWKPGDLPGYLKVLSHLTYREWRHSTTCTEKCVVFKGSDPSGMKDCVTPPNYPSGLAGVMAESEESLA